MRATMLLLPLCLVACNREPEPAGPATDPPAPAEQAPTESVPAESATGDQTLLNPESTDLGGIAVAAPAAWTTQTPANPMRRAQFVVDGPDGEATCVVFFFRGEGTIQANIDRWCSQFAQPDGSDSRDRARIDTITVNGHEVTTFALAGRYIAETSPGSGQRLDNPNWAVKAAIVPMADGAFYFKMTGPESTIAEQADAFDAMIASIG